MGERENIVDHLSGWVGWLNNSISAITISVTISKGSYTYMKTYTYPFGLSSQPVSKLFFYEKTTNTQIVTTVPTPNRPTYFLILLMMKNVIVWYAQSYIWFLFHTRFMFSLYKAYWKKGLHLSFRVDKWEFEFKAVDIFTCCITSSSPSSYKFLQHLHVNSWTGQKPFKDLVIKPLKPP